jgi:hypothetical protein
MTTSSDPQPQQQEGPELKPCPFGPPPEHLPPVVKEVNATQGTYWWVGCEIHLSPSAPPTGCGVGHSALTREEAIAKWQSRADLPRATVEAVSATENHVFTCVRCSRQWTVVSNHELECFFSGLCYWCLRETGIGQERVKTALLTDTDEVMAKAALELFRVNEIAAVVTSERSIATVGKAYDDLKKAVRTWSKSRAATSEGGG